jgi:hypothetical protein
MSEYRAQSPKRERRRREREQAFGPERLIRSTSGGFHVLECGHRVEALPTELPHIQRRRCAHCRGESVPAEARWR